MRLTVKGRDYDIAGLLGVDRGPGGAPAGAIDSVRGFYDAAAVDGFAVVSVPARTR